MSDYEQLNIELKRAGVPDYEFMGEKGMPIDTLVNTGTSSKPYLSILLHFLPRLSGNEKEMVVRALTEKGNKEAVPFLLEIFKRPDGLSEHSLWAVGNALYTIDYKDTYPSIVELCKNQQLGIARGMLVRMLSRVKTEEVFQLLVDSINDSTVKGDAIEALGRFGDLRAISILEKIEVDKTKYEYKARETALRRLTKKSGR